MEGSGHGASNAEVVTEEQKAAAERVVYLKSHMNPDAPKVGSSGSETPAMNRAAGEAQATIQETGEFEERWKRMQAASNNYKARNTTQQNPRHDGQGQGSPENRVKYAADHLNPGAPMVGSSGRDVADAIFDMDGGEDMLWQSALNRFDQESTTQSNVVNGSVGHLEDEYPPTLSQISNQEHKEQQEQQDWEYARRMTESMNMMGGSRMEMDYDPSSLAAGDAEEAYESTEKLSLWQTFKVLYKRHSMVKYYIIGLLILLVAMGAIIGVSVSQNNKGTKEDCATAVYPEKPFVLLPEESQSVQAGDFGVSISASSDYLVVGAPNSACNSQGPSCDDFTVGGGAYLYKRNSKQEWALYSSFILDDGISPGDAFGQSVAIAQDSSMVVVGAPEDDGLGNGATIFQYNPSNQLVSDDIGFNDQLGGSVSIATTTLGKDSPIRVTNVVAGASFHNVFGSSSGGVYVFSKFDDEPPASACGGDRSIPVGKFIQCQKIVPDDGEAHDQFGKAVDISERTIVVGAMWDDDRGIDSGAAYVYSLGDDGNWSQQEKLLPINLYSQANRFGHSVATSGDRIVVGADLDDSQGDDSGSAYLYRLSSGVWNLESKLVPPINPGTGNNQNYECGFSVDINKGGTTVVVGCPGAPGGGVAYVYDLQESRKWVQTEKLSVPSVTIRTGMRSGNSVTMSTGEDNMAVVGYGESNGEVFSYRKDC
eukprot:CAMPEP_0181110920 /NCGR_PEP_ID=MMETSP1071-20121207/18980_1 /TAXON_ID=35127 /ORGANISM="Thalassiosira sp., Strain NH16" /LENGTH=707 /DNA_ID=CAMNT_0023194741 /DNA_START=55 /DNA_END=2179 /DNA_ORIENTATION=-